MNLVFLDTETTSLRHDRRAWVGRFHDRYPRNLVDTFAEHHVLRDVGKLTAGATIVGAVPWFDTDVLGQRMRANNMCPCWHYHLVDVEALAAGQLRLPPKWGFDGILAHYGLAYNEAERHTALGDARLVRDLYDKVMAA